MGCTQSQGAQTAPPSGKAGQAAPPQSPTPAPEPAFKETEASSPLLVPNKLDDDDVHEEPEKPVASTAEGEADASASTTSPRPSPDNLEDQPAPLQERQPATNPPWVRFGCLWICCCLASGLVPGQSVFVELVADAGVFGSLCTGGDSELGCKQQYVALTGVFTTCSSLAYMFLAPIGLFFDVWGARKTGTLGAAVCALGMFLVWMSMVGAASGMDSSTSALFAVGVGICDFGAMLNSFCFMGLIWHFPGHQSLIITLINSTYQVSAFLPLLLKGVMHATGSPFAPVMLVYTGLVLGTIVVCWMLIPTQAEYYRQAKLVLGLPLPKPPANVDVCKMLKRAVEVLRLNTRDHVASGLTLTFGFAFPSFYGSMAAPYGKELFGTKEDGDRLATMYASATGIVGLLLAPVAGGLADRFGLLAFVLFLAIVQAVGCGTCGVENWSIQLVCTLCLVLLLTLILLFVNRYLLMYSPPNRFGTVQGVYTLAVMIVATPITYGSLTVTELLPEGPDAYRVPMWVTGGLGYVALFLYAFYFRAHPPPEVPPLLPEDEAELARNFGCSNLDEVMLVTHENDKGRLIKMLASTDPDVMQNLIRRIDTQKMVELMEQQPIEDVAAMMEQRGMDEEEEDQDGAAVDAASPLLQDVKTEAQSEVASTAATMEAGSPAAGEKMEVLNDKYVSLINNQDRAGLRAYMLEENVDDMWELQLYMEGRYSKAELARMDKVFNKILPGSEFAKLLKERPELRTLVQRLMKREMDKKLAWAKRKRT